MGLINKLFGQSKDMTSKDCRLICKALNLSQENRTAWLNPWRRKDQGVYTSPFRNLMERIRKDLDQTDGPYSGRKDPNTEPSEQMILSDYPDGEDIPLNILGTVLVTEKDLQEKERRACRLMVRHLADHKDNVTIDLSRLDTLDSESLAGQIAESQLDLSDLPSTWQILCRELTKGTILHKLGLPSHLGPLAEVDALIETLHSHPKELGRVETKVNHAMKKIDFTPYLQKAIIYHTLQKPDQKLNINKQNEQQMNVTDKQKDAALLIQAMRTSLENGNWLNRGSQQYKPKTGQTPFDTLKSAMKAEDSKKDGNGPDWSLLGDQIEKEMEHVSKNLAKIETSEEGADYQSAQDTIYLPKRESYNNDQEFVHDFYMAASLATGHPDRFNRKGANLGSEGVTEEETIREQFTGEMVAAGMMIEAGYPAPLAPDSIEFIDKLEEMVKKEPKLFEGMISDYNNIISALRDIKTGKKADFQAIATRQQEEQLLKSSEGDAPVQDKASQELVRQKSQSEQKAAERQVALITNALMRATKGDTVWMNPAGKRYPAFYPKGPSISPFNAINLTLFADEKGYKSNLYTTFQEARIRKEGVLSMEKGVPFNWYNWNRYVNRNKPDEIITRKDYLALNQEERSQYKGIHNREIRTLFNIDQTLTPSVDPTTYGHAIGWNGASQEKPSDKGNKALRGSVDAFLNNISKNLVTIERDSGLAVSTYDMKSDIIRIPAPNSYIHYHDFVHDAISEIVRSTGHAERLAREGAVNRTVLANQSKEELIVELATGVKMLELGMPARLSKSSQKMVEDWVRELKEDPKMIDAVETDVNNALEVIRKAERGEKVIYSSFINQQKARLLQEKQKPQVSSSEALVLADIICHHGMEIRNGNFRTPEEKEDFLKKFGMDYYLHQEEYARMNIDPEDEEMKDAAYTEINNNAAYIDELAREYRPADWNLKGRRDIEEMIHDIMDTEAKDIVIVLDKESNKADVILRDGAFQGGKVILPNGNVRNFYVTPDEVLSEQEKADARVEYNDSLYSKQEIIEALKAREDFNPEFVRFFNREGVAGFHADDRYFEGKELYSGQIDSGQLDELRSYDIEDKVSRSRSPMFEKVMMLKDDEDRWVLFLKPQDERPFGMYPDKADINKFFTAAHQGNAVISDAVRQELSVKYYELAKVNPSLQVNLLGEKANEEDASRLQRVNIFKNKEGKFMIIAKVTDTPKDVEPREITSTQWQRLWLSPDKEEYKRDLAAKIFADVLHPEIAQMRRLEEEKEEEENKKSVKRSAAFIAQYDGLKKRHPDTLLLFRSESHYEIFMKDAEAAGPVLGLKVEKSTEIKDQLDEPILTVSFPYERLDSYLPKLIRAGHRVAICDHITETEDIEKRETQEPVKEEKSESHRSYHR